MASPLEFLADLEQQHRGESSESQPAARNSQADMLRSSLMASAEAYRWARRDRPPYDFHPRSVSGDTAIGESAELMHGRVRSEAINNPLIKRAAYMLADLTVGTGLQTYSWPFLPWELLQVADEIQSAADGVLSPRLKYALESDDLFDEWFSDPQQFDVQGRRSGQQMQRDVFSECVQVGHGLMLRVFVDRPGRISPLAYQMIEREQLDTSRDRPRSDGQNKIVGGIEFDRDGRMVAAYIFDAHPDDVYSSSTQTNRSRRITRDRLVSLCRYNRPSSSIGATWFDAAGQPCFDRDSYVGSEIRAADKASRLAVVHKTEHPHLGNQLGLGDDELEELLDAYGESNDSVKFGFDPLAVTVGREDDVEIVESNRPNPNANNFFEILDHSIAVALELSYYTLTGNYKGISYVGIRGAKLDEELHIRPIQRFVGAHVALPIRREFNAIAAAGGEFESITPREFRKNRRRWQRFEQIGTRRQLLDPARETGAVLDQLRGGLVSYPDICTAIAGKPWHRVLFENAVATRLAGVVGVTLDWSKGNGGNANDGDKSDDSDAGQQATNQVNEQEVAD